MNDTPPACFNSFSHQKFVSLSALPLFVGVLLALTGCGGGSMGTSNATTATANATSSQSAESQSASQPSVPTTPAAPPADKPVAPPAAPPATPPNQNTIAGIQKMSGWTWCTAKLNGQTCASGLGNADSSMTPDQQTPSLSGSSSMFWIGGPTPYSNALWWRELGADSKPTHFNYDLYFYLEDSNAPEALEFDVNQTIGGTRYIWGTECSYHDTGHWQIWNSKGNKWFNTNVPCPQVSPKTWHHLVWQFERVKNQAHFIGVSLDGKYTAVDKYFDPQKYGNAGISVAFQLDGNHHQTPYKVWLDKVNLVSW